MLMWSEDFINFHCVDSAVTDQCLQYMFYIYHVGDYHKNIIMLLINGCYNDDDDDGKDGVSM